MSERWRHLDKSVCCIKQDEKLTDDHPVRIGFADQISSISRKCVSVPGTLDSAPSAVLGDDREAVADPVCVSASAGRSTARGVLLPVAVAPGPAGALNDASATPSLDPGIDMPDRSSRVGSRCRRCSWVTLVPPCMMTDRPSTLDDEDD